MARAAKLAVDYAYRVLRAHTTEFEAHKAYLASLMIIPSTTNFYTITAPGIDKIEGPGEFTMPKFHDIRIEATGQNIITLGDGNQIDARFGDLGGPLAELRNAITTSQAPESTKLEFVADIDTIQSQLAKPEPTRSVIKAAWEVVKGAAAINGCTVLVSTVAGLLQHFL